MAETLIKNFKQLSKTDTEIAGGKGASLGEMTQAGIPVPQGFVILANAFDKFIEKTNLKSEIIKIRELGTGDDNNVESQEFAIKEEVPNLLLVKEYVNTLPDAGSVLNERDIEKAISLCNSTRGPVAKVLKQGLTNYRWIWA